MKPTPRKCAYCGKQKGNTSFVYWRRGERKRDYFHPACFSTFLVETEQADKDFLA